MTPPVSPATLRQHDALLHGAAVAEFPGRTEIELTGRDRASFLHNFCTGDVKRLAPGQGCEAFFCNLQGRILGHGYIFCRAEVLVIDTVADQAESLLKHLDRYLIREDVQFHDRTARVGKLLFSGPAAAAMFERLGAVAPPAERCGNANARIGDEEVSIRRVDFTGPDCTVIDCDAAHLAAVRAELLSAGATPCEADAVEIARVEAGTPIYGRDISEKNLPQEVGRDKRAISFTKGCYLGQETVARIDALGHVNRYLVGLKFAGEQLPEIGASLSAPPAEPAASATGVAHSGEPGASAIDVTASKPVVGEITSAVWSPRVSAPLALAYVRREHCRPGTRLFCGEVAAEVIALPLV